MTQDVLRISLDELNRQYERLRDPNDKYIYLRYINIGLIKKRLSDYQGAEKAWLGAIEYNPEQSLAFGNLADLYLYQLKDYPKAEEYYRKVLTMNPNHFEYYLGLISLYRYNLTEKKDMVESLMNDGAAINTAEAENYYLYLANYFAEGPENYGGNDLTKAKYYTQKTLELNSDLKDQLPDL